MIKNIFKVSLRYLAKHKGYTLINIVGLAVSIAACILIMLFVRCEMSFNAMPMHGNSDRIHRAWLPVQYQEEIFNNTAKPIPLAPLPANNLPEVELATRITEISAPIKHQGNTYISAVTMVESTLFKIFDFELLKGNINNPFPSKNSIIISESEEAAGPNLENEFAKIESAIRVFETEGLVRKRYSFKYPFLERRDLCAA